MLDTKLPIFVATHPRSCSTAFERVFMTRTEDLECIHEPFGDAFYYGPERLSSRYEGESQEAVNDREQSGFSSSTYKTILENIEKKGNEKEGKRIFIKDMASYLVPPNDHATYQNAKVAPSTVTASNGDSNGDSNGVHKEDNPTVLPLSTLKRYQFAFLIRNPRRAVPSYYRCCIPPLNEMTGFKYFMPNEAGYRELRVLFDYLKKERVIKRTPATAENGVHATNGVNGGSEHTNGTKESNGDSGNKPYEVCVIDADDLLDHPKEVIQTFCEMVGLEFDEGMLEWSANKGCESFDKWKGFHEDAIGSSGLKPRTVKKVKSAADERKEWVEKYGEEAAAVIEKTAEDNMADYEYLRQFRIMV